MGREHSSCNHGGEVAALNQSLQAQNQQIAALTAAQMAAVEQSRQESVKLAVITAQHNAQV